MNTLIRSGRYTVLPVALAVLAVCPAWAQQGEWGDAPEGALAYPFLGVNGEFPTCATVMVAHHILHYPTPTYWAWFGPFEDQESDGNAGTCPSFLPYDLDECFLDGDAGLMYPGAWTIQGTNVLPCPNSRGGTVQDTCWLAYWGQDIDIEVHHSGTPNCTAYVNVLMDWNKDGEWRGSSQCAHGPVPEHVLVDFPVPSHYNGPLSGLLPPPAPFGVGPNEGFVWTRFSLVEIPVGQNWDGAGYFESGETEDYLLEIGWKEPEGDYGDAPHGDIAYPSLGVTGQFPTCFSLGAEIYHGPGDDAYFGPMVDYESEGNTGYCYGSPAFPPYDQDECFGDGDAGLIMPPAYTIDTSGVVVPCPACSTGALGTACANAVWGQDVDIAVVNNAPDNMYVNVLADWNQDGTWDGSSPCPSGSAPEHVLVDFVVPAVYNGPLSGLGPPSFLIGPNDGYVWTRFTISPLPVPTDWNGEGSFDDGETCDFLIFVEELSSVGPSETSPTSYRLYPNSPNPFCGQTTILYELPASQNVRLAVYDVSGRLVRTLVNEAKGPGQHQTVWDGTDTSGRRVSPGVYFYRIGAGSFSQTRRMVVVE